MITTYNKPTQAQWSSLISRPQVATADLSKIVDNVFNDVLQNGDAAIQQYTANFDKVTIDNFQVSAKTIAEAANLVSDELKTAIATAKKNIETFHTAQQTAIEYVETMPGVTCWRANSAIENVGIYIPGGSAPLFSTVLMLGIPATIAGCKEIILCSPPDKEGNIHPAILYTAQLVGITKIFAVGGIQAIAGLCLGTTTLPKVDKIFGPGNQYVTAAKQKALQYGVAIDMPAGPSEVLVIADDTANANFVAADLLSQAEHGADSQVILLSNSNSLVNQTLAAIEKQLATLPRKAIAEQALKNSKVILLENINDCIDFSNRYAPEHLIIAVDNAENYISHIINAGSVFIGNYSCESMGDYASGTNHTLPTNGYAKNYSGVSLDSFVKKITFQKISKEGLQLLGPAVATMAAAEQLAAHKNAVTIRLNTL
ncbi:histidinol dehydrogenase [Ferruginibacter yonginensis]|uniref:Histidinol dehydrogenase n=1 Tax=Ferruginibacter yonginensis TaxID=1310416 RepID=A0ABV8QPH8_9BACT